LNFEDSLKFHSSYKSSDTIINFFDNSVTSTVQTSTTTTKSSTLANIDIKWKSVNNLINFEMSSQTLTDRYVAFGLSEDQSMVKFSKNELKLSLKNILNRAMMTSSLVASIQMELLV